MMSTHHRTQRLSEAYGGPLLGQGPTSPSPREAQALVDQAISRLGMDPEAVTDADGCRHIGLGTARGLINVIEWEEGIHFLAMWSPILRAPQDRRLRAELFEELLELNHQSTGMARFSMHNDMIILAAVRPIHGIDVEEVLEAIHTVMYTADLCDERLQHFYQVQMPQIEMDDETWQGILSLLRLCDAHVQQIFVYLMEHWVAEKGKISTGSNTVGLQGKISGKSVAGLIGHASAGPIVTVGWDSLEKVQGLSPKDATAFKDVLPRPERFQVTGHSAHLPVDASFTQEVADQLIDALRKLDRGLERAVPPAKPPLPDLSSKWGLSIQVGGATQRNIDALLEACTEPVQQIYVRLIQGWHDTGQALYTNNPDRVYLRLAVDQHNFALCTLWGPRKTKGPKIELRYPLTYYFETHLEARRRYEQQIAQIPRFGVHNSGARILLEEGFTVREADRLLRVLQTLAQDITEDKP